MENRLSNITYQKPKYQDNLEVQLLYKQCRYYENLENEKSMKEQGTRKTQKIYIKHQKARYKENQGKQIEIITGGTKKILRYKENITKRGSKKMCKG